MVTALTRAQQEELEMYYRKGTDQHLTFLVSVCRVSFVGYLRIQSNVIVLDTCSTACIMYLRVLLKRIVDDWMQNSV